ncbi:hypothetical protein V6Z12_A02G085900 [Gossypium hirsutum]
MSETLAFSLFKLLLEFVCLSTFSKDSSSFPSYLSTSETSELNGIWTVYDSPFSSSFKFSKKQLYSGFFSSSSSSSSSSLSSSPPPPPPPPTSAEAAAATSSSSSSPSSLPSG